MSSMEAKYAHAIKANHDWRTVWLMFYEDETFQRILNVAAKKAIRNASVPMEWLDDVTQGAMLLFALQIQKSTKLNYNTEKGRLTGWIYTIIFGCCRKSLRQFKDSMRQYVCEEITDSLETQPDTFDLTLDIEGILESVSQRDREIFCEYVNGTNLDLVARRYKIQSRTCYRSIKKVKEKIHRLLNTTSQNKTISESEESEE